MTRLEMVETLREKAGVSYDDAREALEKNNWDMLDAAIALKRDTDFGTGESKSGAVQGTQTREEPSDGSIRDFASGIGDKFSVGLRFLLSILAK